MIRTISLVEKNVTALPANTIVVPANTDTIVFDAPPYNTSMAQNLQNYHEIAAITIQNCTNGSMLYYAFGETCDGTKNFHGMLLYGSQLNVPLLTDVHVFSTTQTTVAVTILKRDGGI